MSGLSESDVQRIVKDSVAESQDDYVGLWQIIGDVEAHITDPIELREQTLRVVRNLLARGLLAGDPPYSAHGFQVWADQRPDAVIDRIRSEWIALGETPNIPHIVWFSAPD